MSTASSAEAQPPQAAVTSGPLAAFAPDLFRGRRIVVTGGTSGIGRGIAIAFAALGGAVHALAADPAEVAAAAADPAMAGIACGVLDVRDDDAVAAALAGFDTLDVLVCAAGIIRRGAEEDPATFARILDVNLTGTLRCCTAARPALARAGGSVLALASVLTWRGGGLVPGYAASKGGIGQLVKSLAIAWAPDGIRVNAVAPGWIATPLTRALREDPARAGAILDRTPLRRWGTPEDLAGAALFLCSPAAAFVTGTILAVDGGYLAT